MTEPEVLEQQERIRAEINGILDSPKMTTATREELSARNEEVSELRRLWSEAGSYGNAAKLIALLRVRSMWGVELERAMPWVACWTRVRSEARRLLAATHETIESVLRSGSSDHLWAIAHDYSRWPRREVL